MLNPDETFGGSFPFKPNWLPIDGGRMHYVDEGSGDTTILLLHGEPTWSFLYRSIIPRLSQTCRVIAPDMVGFGKSDSPAAFDYAPKNQVACLIGLMRTLNLNNVVLVCHDWGGPIGAAAALAEHHRIRAIVGMNTSLTIGVPEEFEALGDFMLHSPYFQWMGKLHEAGAMDTVLGELSVIVPAIMKGLQGFSAPLTPLLIEAYGAPFRGEHACKGATALPRAMVDGSFLPAPPDPDRLSAVLSKPAMLLYGMQDRVLPAERFIPAFKALFGNAPVHELHEAGHFLQEDAPEKIVSRIDEFVRGLS